jgi:hypothetical protein
MTVSNSDNDGPQSPTSLISNQTLHERGHSQLNLAAKAGWVLENRADKLPRLRFLDRMIPDHPSLTEVLGNDLALLSPVLAVWLKNKGFRIPTAESPVKARSLEDSLITHRVAISYIVRERVIRGRHGFAHQLGPLRINS